ncbi:MAG: TetR/AcrR family transcriptional regulator [Polyangiaceae bacterium]|nr:TetR/AcrR family transcriptional regulator [Polyangiaceae bacterium]
MKKFERRQELLRAARSVFAEKGYHEAKVDDIVALAKVAKGTFYLDFPDKRSVFAELVHGLFTRLGGAILHVDPAADVDAQIKHNIRAIVAVLLDDAALTSILLSYSAGLDPAFVTQVRSFHQEVKRLMVEALEEGQRLGIVEPGDTKLYATFTIGALKEVLFENAMGEAARHREQIVTALFDVIRRGYLRIDGDRPAPAEQAAKGARVTGGSAKVTRRGRSGG